MSALETLRNVFETPKDLTEEALSQEFQDSCAQVISAQAPIDIASFQHMALGDSILEFSTLSEVFKVFCKKRNLPLPIFVGGRIPGFNLQNATKVYASKFYCPIPTKTARERYLGYYHRILGIDESEIQLGLPPELVQVVGYAPFAEINVDSIAQEAARIRKQKGRLVAVCQAGSSDAKRFSNAQIKMIENYLTENGIPFLTLYDSVFRNFPQLASYLLAAERIITTDTGWAWCAGASHRSVYGDDNVKNMFENKMIVLHTQSSQYWQVPLSYGVFGAATQEPDLITVFGVMENKDFVNFYGTSIEDGIHRMDFDHFMNELDFFFKELNPWQRERLVH